MLFIPALVSALFLSAMGVHGSSQCAIWKQKSGSALQTTAQNIAGSPGSSVGACGVSYAEGTRFVMLWNALNSNVQRPAGSTPGWLTGATKQNCGKQVKVTANNKSVIGVVVESGSFSQSPLGEKIGCSSISISNQMMTDLGAHGGVKLPVTWEFVGAPF
ncbi:uncharacterized protein MELLADRAFT_88155 [Melampsora larici-populina 98AG31]|uniref:Secreted protein n=1 Tax=Melampsora larici-populina (strain 98AG31 / pathotype 3-4-7) TaxID=747676 RepID=F4RQR8_MELLP|nr:uncharacterized protein MELLADRAFT_88155 [Melampsora larici-populina 98AG31]EGG05085.1 secreted protein [Melampsora larici-populina 98AG31]